jgi:sulfotransferase family protein
MTESINKIFVGGYTKSGTTFIGRALDILNGVYAKGELEYFRLFYRKLNGAFRSFNENIRLVNEEVYDGQGSILPLSKESLQALHEKIFLHIFFNGEAVPDDCVCVVEKTPRSIFSLKKINHIFPTAQVVCVYRDPEPVLRSLFRHLIDHRSSSFSDPNSKARRKLFNGFLENWDNYINILEDRQVDLHLVQYDRVAVDTAGFLDFAQEKILKTQLGLSAPIETLSKEHYLNNLPEEARAKSLVQIGQNKVQLSDEEFEKVAAKCRKPDVIFDF